VHLEAFGAAPDRSDRAGKPVHVLFVGWMIEAKGVRELLAAAANLPDARFTLVGPPEPSFTVTVEDELARLRDHVRVLPVQPRDEVYRLYREADVFVLPTWREGFPNVVIEAMAAGLPVVSTPVGAIPEAVEDGRSGLLVPVRDAAALEAALRRLIDDAQLRVAMGRRGRERVESTFSFEAVVARLAAIYRELVQ
jgi:glycosyltransferase involved in cell wall biosynthesis